MCKDSGDHLSTSSMLENGVARPLLEKTFHLRIQSRYEYFITDQKIVLSWSFIARKVFMQREACERLLAEQEDKLGKVSISYSVTDY